MHARKGAIRSFLGLQGKAEGSTDSLDPLAQWEEKMKIPIPHGMAANQQR